MTFVTIYYRYPLPRLCRFVIIYSASTTHFFFFLILYSSRRFFSLSFLVSINIHVRLILSLGKTYVHYTYTMSMDEGREGRMKSRFSSFAGSLARARSVKGTIQTGSRDRSEKKRKKTHSQTKPVETMVSDGGATCTMKTAVR